MAISLSLLPLRAQKSSQPPSKFTERVQKQVTHEILMLPYYDVFDVIGFKVKGYTVTLFGHVVNAMAMARCSGMAWGQTGRSTSL